MSHYCQNCSIVAVSRGNKYCDDCAQELVDWLYRQECEVEDQIADQQYLEEVASRQEDLNYDDYSNGTGAIYRYLGRVRGEDNY